MQVFTPDGGYLRQFGKNGSGNGELSEPVSICVDSDDLVYVGRMGTIVSQCSRVRECFSSRLDQMDLDQDSSDGPYGIAVDQCGVVYVSDYGNNRVQIFS